MMSIDLQSDILLIFHKLGIRVKSTGMSDELWFEFAVKAIDSDVDKVRRNNLTESN